MGWASSARYPAGKSPHAAPKHASRESHTQNSRALVRAELKGMHDAGVGRVHSLARAPDRDGTSWPPTQRQNLSRACPTTRPQCCGIGNQSRINRDGRWPVDKAGYSTAAVLPLCSHCHDLPQTPPLLTASLHAPGNPWTSAGRCAICSPMSLVSLGNTRRTTGSALPDSLRAPKHYSAKQRLRVISP